MKDNCDSDSSWCFKSAVGKNLPSSFFSYSGSKGKVPASVSASASGALSAPSTNTTSAAPEQPTKNAKDQHNDAASLPSSSPSATPSPSSASPSPSSASVNATSCNTHKGRSMSKLHKRSRHARVAHEKRDAAQDANTKGYSDGVQAAKTFAAFNMSKLGFTQQYIHDNLATLGSGVVKSSNQGDYTDGFLKGLQDGETQVSKA